MTPGLPAGGATLFTALAVAAAIVVLTAPDHGPRRLSRLTSGRRLAVQHISVTAAADAGVHGRWLAAGAAAAGTLVLVKGPIGVVLALLAGLITYRVLQRLEPRAVVAQREQIARDLPVAAHLLAGALSAGASPVSAIELVAAAIGGPLALQLRRVAALTRLGGDLGATWRSIPTGSGLAPLARTVARALETGAPLADALDRLAADLRSQQRFEVDRRARAVGVHAAAPLGLCFLPAFLLIGVVPVVIGVATTILTTIR